MEFKRITTDTRQMGAFPACAGSDSSQAAAHQGCLIEGELSASERLSQAAAIDRQPAAMTLRYMQTLTEIAVEQNSTIIFPLPVELMRMLRDSEKRVTYDRRPRR